MKMQQLLHFLFVFALVDIFCLLLKKRTGNGGKVTTMLNLVFPNLHGSEIMTV